MINLQTQLFGNNIYHRTVKIIQKHLPYFKLSKTVGLGFMAGQTHVEKFWFLKNILYFWILLLSVCWHENATLTKYFGQGQSYSENNLSKYCIFERQALIKHDISLSGLRLKDHHVWGLEVGWKELFWFFNTSDWHTFRQNKFSSTTSTISIS